MADAVWICDPDPVAFAGARVAEALARIDAEHGRARLAIPGGSALAALAATRKQLRETGVWTRMHLTWVDERCVPEANAASNRGTAARAALLDGPGPAETLPLFLDGEAGAEAAARADAALRERFAGAVDVVLLGMGEDGHVASLFPGAALSETALVAHVTASPKPPPERITLTRTALETARCTVLLATGEGKRRALARLRTGDPSLPACGLPALTVVTDVDLGRGPEADLGRGETP